MHDDLIPSQPRPEEDPGASGPLPAPSVQEEAYLGYEDSFDEPPQRRGSQRQTIQRYIWAVLRRKWLLLAALVVGVAGAAGAYSVLSVEYTAQGNLWVQVDLRGEGSAGPIRQGELLESYGWIELLKSFAVLDPVVVSQKLYLSSPKDYAPAFSTFTLAERFRPGSYVLKIGSGGKNYVLTQDGGTVLESGALGDSIGVDYGFRWQPRAKVFAPDAEIPFSILTPRDAARTLQTNLRARMDREGNFISLSLSGADPEKSANTLNAIMDRYVELAAQLKRRKLDAQLTILEDQLHSTEQQLAQAERDLESFRVKTITLPSDASTPIAPGLELTRGPVFNRFFQMKLDLEQTKRDREQLAKATEEVSNGSVRLELLEAIPEVGQSSEMSQALTELVSLRAQLRTLRNDFTDDYPPIQDLLRQIGTLENQTIPNLARGLMAELQAKETRLSTMVDSASEELSEIPPRTIEEARLTRQVNIQENLYNELRQRVETARLASAGSIADVQILDRAAVPQVPTTDQRLRFAAMILLGSLGGAVGLALLLDRVDKRIRYAEEVDSFMGLDILGSIPRIDAPGDKGADENAAQVVEAFRELRMTVSFAHGSAGPLLLTLTSPAKGEGKTLVTTNLAVAFAEMGKRTLLIDADTRQGDAHRLLGLSRKPGLTDYLRDRSGADIIQGTEYKNLEFIGCGSRGMGTPELLASARMATFMGTLKRAYDVILVDSPPLAAGADTLVLAGLTGNLGVILRTGSTDKRLAIAKLETLSRLPIRILGAILNDVEPKGDYYRYYGSYLPGYQTRPEGEQDEEEELGQASRLLSASRAGAGDDLD